MNLGGYTLRQICEEFRHDSVSDGGINPHLLGFPCKDVFAMIGEKIDYYCQNVDFDSVCTMGYSLKEICAAGFSLSPRLVGDRFFRLENLPESLSKLTELLAAGYSIRDMQTPHNYWAWQGRNDGMLVKKRAIVECYRAAGISLKELKEELNIHAEYLKESKFTFVDFHDAGYTIVEISGIIDFTLAEMKEAGFTTEQLLEVCMKFEISCEEMKAVGISLVQARMVGYKYDQCIAGGYTLKEACEAGLSCEEARAHGASCQEVGSAGYTPTQARRGSCLWSFIKAVM